MSKITIQKIILGIVLVLFLVVGQFISNILIMKGSGESLEYCLTILKTGHIFKCSCLPKNVEISVG